MRAAILHCQSQEVARLTLCPCCQLEYLRQAQSITGLLAAVMVIHKQDSSTPLILLTEPD